MNDDELDRLLGGLPFADAETTVEDDALREWHGVEEASELGEALIGSAAARAQLEALDEPKDEVGVARLRWVVFPTRRRWLVPAAISTIAAAAALVFLMSRPDPAPDYNAPVLSGGKASVRSGDATPAQVYPSSGRIVLLLRPKKAREAVEVGVYAVAESTLLAVDPTVKRLEDGIIEIGIEVSRLPGEGARQVTLLTVLGDGTDGLDGQATATARSNEEWQIFPNVVTVEGGIDEVRP